MSQKQLDFSKHNLTIDLAEVKRMFNEDLSGGGRYLLEEFFHQVMAHDLSRQGREGHGGMSGRRHEGGIGMVIGSVIF
jgi:hypothetical protein